VCATCGRPVDEHERNVRYVLPDPVFDLPDASEPRDVDERAERQRVGDAACPRRRPVRPRAAAGEADRPVLGHVRGVGKCPSHDLQRAFKTWWAPEYVDLEGRLANQPRPWGLRAASVELKVPDENHTPYAVASADECLSSVLDAGVEPLRRPRRSSNSMTAEGHIGTIRLELIR
jgi:hypothetical protein